jgi:enoyl-CoA hydratase/carnithine racemase
MSEDLLYEADHGIGRITFNRPQVLNAFTFEMYERMAEICRQMERDSSVRALVLTGAGGKAFASGTDISQFRAFSRPEDTLEYEARMDRVLDALESCPIPTIAAIAGTCTGGGLSIAACCDLRIGAANSRLGCPMTYPGYLPLLFKLCQADRSAGTGACERNHLYGPPSGCRGGARDRID